MIKTDKNNKYLLFFTSVLYKLTIIIFYYSILFKEETIIILFDIINNHYLFNII